MPRYLQVKGVKGKLVGSPTQGNTRAFVGQSKLGPEKLDELRKTKGPLDQGDMYEPREDVVAAEASILSAVAAGELEALGEPVVAHSLSAARELVAGRSAAARKPSKGADK